MEWRGIEQAVTAGGGAGRGGELDGVRRRSAGMQIISSRIQSGQAGQARPGQDSATTSRYMPILIAMHRHML